MTITDICNIALMSVGASPINSYANDPSKSAQVLRRIYPTVARRILLSHEWKDAIGYTALLTEATDSYTSHATDNDIGDTTIVVTAAIDSDTPQSGKVTIGGDEYDYASWTGSTFTLETGEALTADYDASDSVTVIPNNYNDMYEYMYDLPTDCLKALSLEHDVSLEFKVEGSCIFTNEYDSDDGILLRYVRDIRDEAGGVIVYGEHIADAIAADLAVRIAPALLDVGALSSMIAVLRVTAMEALEDAMEADASIHENADTGHDWWVDYS